MKMVDLFLQFISKVFSLKTRSRVGLSFDNKVSLKEIPATPLMSVGKFIEFNKELVYFEVTKVDNTNRKVSVCEICTSNEFEMDFALFEYLFKESPVPEECKL